MGVQTLLCPRCGEWMDETHPDFPRCVFCGEHLLRCGVCRHFPGEGQSCRLAKGHPVVYDQTVLDCPYHTPRFVVRRVHPVLAPHARWQMLASFVFTLSVALVAFLSRPTPQRLLLGGSAPTQAVVGDTIEVRLLVNSENQTPVRLRLDRRMLAVSQLVGIDPQPTRVEQKPKFYDIILPTRQGVQPVTVRLKSTQAGEYALKVTVMTANQDIAEWQAKVVVLKQAPSRRPPRRLGVLAMALWR